jgi:DNA-binding XRE family transcriptional regulator
MNNDFPRILSLLRSEKHLSQKKAAEDLGIAQALLSHYEKGKRECGLDFLVRAADYYNVSTDYLLGRSPVSSGLFLRESDIPESDSVAGGKADGFSFSSSLAKKLIISSIDVIFSLLNKIKNKKLTHSISTILSLSIYKSFRLVYKQGSTKNEKNLFMIPEEAAFRAATAGELFAEGNALTAIGEPDNTAIEITTASLESEFNKQAAALLNLIRNSENMIKKYE